jgi:hypothetical protein
MGLVDDLKSNRDVWKKEDQEKEISTILYRLEEILPKYFNFKNWGFQLTYKKEIYPNGPFLIYENKFCRVKFTYNIERYQWHDELMGYFGRQHASNDSEKIIWKGKECRCWFGEWDKLVQFIEGETAVHAFETKLKVCLYYNQFFEISGLEELKKKNFFEFNLQKEKFIWEKYGPEIFKIFDVNNSELWNRFYQFNWEYEQLEFKEWQEKKPNDWVISPPFWQIC